MLLQSRTLACLILVGLTVSATGVRAQTEDFRIIQAKDLVKKPQQYWAQGFIFKDTLETAPAGKPRKFGERTALSFRAKTVGECWCDDVLVPALRDIKPGSECLFTATVFQEHGWFSDKYFVIIQQVAASSVNLTDIGKSIAALQAYDSNEVYAVTAQRYDQLQSLVQAELMAYAAEKNLTMREIFDPGSPHRERLYQAIHGSITKLEQDLRQPSSAFLIDLVAALMAQPHLEPSLPAPAASNAPPAGTSEVEKIVVQKPAEQSTLTPTNAAEQASVATNTPTAPKAKRRSFFARLFGFGSSKPKAVVAEPAVKEPAAPVEPAKPIDPAPIIPDAEPVPQAPPLAEPQPMSAENEVPAPAR